MNTQSAFDPEFNERQFITFRLANLQNALNTQAGRVLKAKCDLSLTEWRILLLITVWEIDHMAAITRTASMDKGQVSRAARKLADKGYVVMSADETDARAQVLEVTPEGKALQERVLPYMLRRQERLQRDITAEELRVMHSVIDKLADAARLEEF